MDVKLRSDADYIVKHAIAAVMPDEAVRKALENKKSKLSAAHIRKETGKESKEKTVKIAQQMTEVQK